MPYVYVLKSLRDGKKYTGSTINLRRRIEEHNAGKVRSTKSRLPLVLFGYQKCSSLKEAAHYEKRYKRSHDLVKRMIKSGKIVLVDNGM